MTVFFTADTHFRHSNIIRHDNRPFASTQEMDEVLIKNWNSRVQPNDTIYHLGDVGVGPPKTLAQILERLNGKIFLIRGNHDAAAAHRDCAGRFEWIKDYHLAKFNGGIQMVLFHYALRVWDGSRHGVFHLYGHSHGRLANLRNSIDLGTNCWGYKPVTLDEVLTSLRT